MGTNVVMGCVVMTAGRNAIRVGVNANHNKGQIHEDAEHDDKQRAMKKASAAQRAKRKEQKRLDELSRAADAAYAAKKQGEGGQGQLKGMNTNADREGR